MLALLLLKSIVIYCRIKKTNFYHLYRFIMPNMYIICGCNGAGKTTASYTVLPEILECKEYINADNIAAGISPFNPDSVAVSAGRIMLKEFKN
ncbi:hypothetical protein OKW96_05705 [Sphingobacterium sp. KU25419]|nr:hypothetical protein OKW96_05705 [Sphingobacterium sp. KU25419]